MWTATRRAEKNEAEFESARRAHDNLLSGISRVNQDTLPGKEKGQGSAVAVSASLPLAHQNTTGEHGHPVPPCSVRGWPEPAARGSRHPTRTAIRQRPIIADMTTTGFQA